MSERLREQDPVRQAMDPKLRPAYDRFIRHLVAGALEVIEAERAADKTGAEPIEKSA